MVARGRCERELSSTYQSFAETGPTYSYLDLSRARSDESLLWSAGDEAAALVAELKASLSPSGASTPEEAPESQDIVEKSPPVQEHQPMRSHSYTNLSSSTTSVEDGRTPPSVHFYPGMTACHYHSGEGVQVPRLRNPPKSAYRKKALESTGNVPKGEVGFPPHSPRTKQGNMKSFGGSWRSLLKMGGMTVKGKPVPGAKKVPPPTVPESGGSSSSSTCSSSSSSSHRHSGSSFSSGVFSSGDQRASFSSSIGEESSSNPPPSPRSPGRDSGCEHTMTGSISSSGSTSSNTSSTGTGTSLGPGIRASNGGGGSGSPSHFQNNSQFTFPSPGPQFAHLMCPKASPGSPHHMPPEATYPYQPYVQQTSLEDQGIDVQSPGRSSPGSGSGSSTSGSTASSGNCRNSTTSLDSGRASSSTQTHTHRLSGQSYDSSSILRHSYHSSSSSLGSMDHDGPLHINVQEMLKNGIPDAEVLRLWLNELHFDEYYDKFLAAGYDLPTISRMTPEDLNAIGITKPGHRKRLKSEINRLNISDGLPDFIPARLEEWLSILRLESYASSLKQQKYFTVDQVTQITWEDLEDVGITKLGHQKKVMLAIKRVKDILAGKKFSSLSPISSHDGKLGPNLGPYPNTNEMEVMGDNYPGAHAATVAFHNSTQFHDHHNRLGCPGDTGVPVGYQRGTVLMNGGYPIAAPGLSPSQMHLKYPGAFLQPEKHHPHAPQPMLVSHPSIHYRPDVVAVNVRATGKAQRGIEEPIYGPCHTFQPTSRPCVLPALPPRPILPLQNGGFCQRSLEDGDITPTNEMAMCNVYEGGGTLPRPRNAHKYRPVAKVTAKTRVDVHPVPREVSKDPDSDSIGLIKTSLKNCILSEKVFPASTNNTPQGTPTKKPPPPPPPKRSNSISESTTSIQHHKKEIQTRKGLSYGYMGVKNNLQPDVTPDLPPPPPAPQDRGNHQHLPEDFPPPPPPLTCITMANTAATCTSTSSGVNHHCGPDSISSYNGEVEMDAAGFRPRRNDSNSSFKSNSSTDSGESLPFANDNAGTIKQRNARAHPPFNLIDSTARSSPRNSPISSPALRRKEGVVFPTLRPTPPPQSTSNSVVPNAVTGCQSTSIKAAASPPDETNDVLSDIGNMLANLTDELDAMLQQELALKNN